MVNPLIRKAPKSFVGNPGNKSPGNFEDHVIRKHIATKEATMGGLKYPTSDGTSGQFMKTDGSGTLSFATSSGSGDVTAAANMTDNTIVKGDGGSKGVQDTGITISDTEQLSGAISLEMSGATSGTTKLIPTAVAGTTTLTLPAATDTIIGKATTDTLTNKSIDGDNNTITNVAIANTKLVAGTNITLATNTLNVDDSFLKNDAVDVGVGLSLTGDNSSADTTYVANVLYNTDATPPTASTVPIGTIYIQYTA